MKKILSKLLILGTIANLPISSFAMESSNLDLRSVSDIIGDLKTINWWDMDKIKNKAKKISSSSIKIRNDKIMGRYYWDEINTDCPRYILDEKTIDEVLKSFANELVNIIKDKNNDMYLEKLRKEISYISVWSWLGFNFKDTPGYNHPYDFVLPATYLSTNERSNVSNKLVKYSDLRTPHSNPLKASFPVTSEYVLQRWNRRGITEPTSVCRHLVSYLYKKFAEKGIFCAVGALCTDDKNINDGFEHIVLVYPVRLENGSIVTRIADPMLMKLTLLKAYPDDLRSFSDNSELILGNLNELKEKYGNSRKDYEEYEKARKLDSSLPCFKDECHKECLGKFFSTSFMSDFLSTLNSVFKEKMTKLTDLLKISIESYSKSSNPSKWGFFGIFPGDELIPLDVPGQKEIINNIYKQNEIEYSFEKYKEIIEKMEKYNHFRTKRHNRSNSK